MANGTRSPIGRPDSTGENPDWIGSWVVDGEVQQLACSPDGRSVGVTVNCKDGSGGVQLRSLDGRMRAGWPKRGAGADGIAFSPDGRFLAVAFRIWQRVQVYDLASGRVVFDEAVPFASTIALSSDGNWLAVGGYTHEGGRVRVWKRSDDGGWSNPRDFELAESYIWGFAFAPGTPVLAVSAGAGSTDSTQAGFYLWNVSTGRDATGPKVRSSRADVGPTVAFAATAPVMAVSSVGEIDTFRTSDWQPASKPLKLVVNDEKRELRTMAFSPDGKYLAGGRDRDLHVWLMADGERLDLRGIHDDTLHTVAFTPDSRRLLTGGKDGKVTVRYAGAPLGE